VRVVSLAHLCGCGSCMLCRPDPVRLWDLGCVSLRSVKSRRVRTESEHRCSDLALALVPQVGSARSIALQQQFAVSVLSCPATSVTLQAALPAVFGSSSCTKFLHGQRANKPKALSPHLARPTAR
jgi:hypothetical protein